MYRLHPDAEKAGFRLPQDAIENSYEPDEIEILLESLEAEAKVLNESEDQEC